MEGVCSTSIEVINGSSGKIVIEDVSYEFIVESVDFDALNNSGESVVVLEIKDFTLHRQRSISWCYLVVVCTTGANDVVVVCLILKSDLIINSFFYIETYGKLTIDVVVVSIKVSSSCRDVSNVLNAVLKI